MHDGHSKKPRVTVELDAGDALGVGLSLAWVAKFSGMPKMLGAAYARVSKRLLIAVGKVGR